MGRAAKKNIDECRLTKMSKLSPAVVIDILIREDNEIPELVHFPADS